MPAEGAQGHIAHAASPPATPQSRRQPRRSPLADGNVPLQLVLLHDLGAADGETALHLAAALFRSNRITFLVASRADASARDARIEPARG